MKYLNTIVKWFLIIGMAAITIIGAYQVVTRFVLNNASSWSEEFIRFAFIWLSMVGSAYGLGKRVHVGIDFFINLCPKPVQKAAEWVIHFAIFVFAIYLTYLGIQLTGGTTKQVSPALGIPMSYVYAAMPVGGILTGIYCIDNAIKDFKATRKKEGTSC